jgi:hypothetical protein
MQPWGQSAPALECQRHRRAFDRDPHWCRSQAGGDDTVFAMLKVPGVRSTLLVTLMTTFGSGWFSCGVNPARRQDLIFIVNALARTMVGRDDKIH